MALNDRIIQSFREKVCKEVDIEKEGVGRYIVYTPFMFDDGDHFIVVLVQKQDEWFLTDEGHTLMHLSYSDIDVETGTRARIIEESLCTHGVQNENGEFLLKIADEDFGDALWSFLQALSGAASVALMTKEKVRTAFFDDFRAIIEHQVPRERVVFDWHHPGFDPDKIYAVDCHVNGATLPWFVFAVNSDRRCQNATISCLIYERADVKFHSLALFEDQTRINRRSLAQLSDVVGKQFSSLGDRKRINAFFRDEIACPSDRA